MKKQEELREQYQDSIEAFDSCGKNCRAILYTGLHGGWSSRYVVGVKAVPNSEEAVKTILATVQAGGDVRPLGLVAERKSGFALLAVYEEYLCFYMLDKWKFKLGIKHKAVIPYGAVQKLKVKHTWTGWTVKLASLLGTKKYRLTLYFSRQAEDVQVLLHHLERKVQ